MPGQHRAARGHLHIKRMSIREYGFIFNNSSFTKNECTCFYSRNSCAWLLITGTLKFSLCHIKGRSLQCQRQSCKFFIILVFCCFSYASGDTEQRAACCPQHVTRVYSLHLMLTSHALAKHIMRCCRNTMQLNAPLYAAPCCTALSLTCLLSSQ